MNVAVALHTGTGRDRFTDDNVLFQAYQMVNLTLDSSVGQNLGGLLEGCCGQEGIGCQGCFGDTKQYLFSFCRLFAFCDQSFVGLV